MDAQEVIATIALTRISGIGSLTAHALMREMGSARRVFENISELPDRLPGFAPRLLHALKDCGAAFRVAEAEYAFACRGGIRCLSFYDEAYPVRMRECADAPLLLYYKGEADLNALHIVGVVGTRKISDYGKQLCENFVRDLAELCPDSRVVSGLAYGVDIYAHRAALANRLPTVGVLAHGLDRIYPYLHRQTAVQMLQEGGLLTEFPSNTPPERQNFVMRNRIIAGICDATVLVESAAKGGSLITAEIAQSYGKDCFAFPGRITDAFSSGCNHLIASHAAQLITSAEDFVKWMGWAGEKRLKKTPVQQSLFAEMTEQEQMIVTLLRERGALQINALVVATNLPVHKLSVVLFEMELKGWVRSLQGGVFRLS